MTEQTPERLKAFRAQYRQEAGQGRFLPALNLVVVLAGFAAVLFVLLRPAPPAGEANAERAGAEPDTYRELAAYLEGKNQPDAAVRAYENYLKEAALPRTERAKVAYRMAQLELDAQQYEAALPHLYEAEWLDPESELKDEIGKKVVLCLEKLGRKVDLRHELRERTRVARTARDVQPGETVLAEFGGEVLTTRDLEQAIEALPAAARDSFATPEKKAELLKNLVAERLLTDKARRLELDKDPEVQDRLAQQLDALIVSKLIDTEVRAGLSITPEDVERFYKAEPERFAIPAAAEVSVGRADTEEAAKGVSEFSGKPVSVRQGGPIPGAPASLKAGDAIFNAEPGQVTAPIEAEGAWYVFKVASKTPGRTPPFEEVKDTAERLLEMQKQQERFSALIAETLKASDARLYPERLAPNAEQ